MGLGCWSGGYGVWGGGFSRWNGRGFQKTLEAGESGKTWRARIHLAFNPSIMSQFRLPEVSRFSHDLARGGVRTEFSPIFALLLGCVVRFLSAGDA